MSAWWSRLSLAQRAGVALLALVAVLNAGGAALESLVGGEPGGPASSSLSTGDDGLAAYADLLAREGRDVQRIDEPLASISLSSPATVVVADPQVVEPDDVVALGRFLAEGGRVVLAGASAGPVLAALTGEEVVAVASAAPADGELAVWVPTGATGGAARLAGDAGTRWIDAGALLPVAGSADGRTDEEGAAIVEGTVGAGRVVALADSTLLHNLHLADADNAALGLALPDDQGPVLFVESVRSTEAAGLAAVPPSWKWTAAGLVVVLGLGLWAAGARFGPPEPAARQLRPARVEHVDAVAAGLRRARPAPDTVSDDAGPGGSPP